MQPDESERGELYPVWSAWLDTFAQFGIGIGLYFFQLLLLAALFICCAIVMIPAMYEYNKDSYGYLQSSGVNKFQQITGMYVITVLPCPILSDWSKANTAQL